MQWPAEAAAAAMSCVYAFLCMHAALHVQTVEAGCSPVYEVDLLCGILCLSRRASLQQLQIQIKPNMHSC